MEKANNEIKHGTIKWDIHMMKIAKLCSEMSKDPSTKVGAVVMGPDKRILATGYNGFPSGVPDYDEWYNNREMKYKLVVHAEMNALQYLKNIPEGSSLFVYPLLPCESCYKEIDKKGIKRIITIDHDKKKCSVCPKEKECSATRWEESWKNSKREMDKNGCKVLYIQLDH
jgi:dCMP deaminase